jgi:hypothetical protein
MADEFLGETKDEGFATAKRSKIWCDNENLHGWGGGVIEQFGR